MCTATTVAQNRTNKKFGRQGTMVGRRDNCVGGIKRGREVAREKEMLSSFKSPKLDIVHILQLNSSSLGH